MDLDNFVTFGDFYSEIRSHFSSAVFDFEEFRRRRSGRTRIEFLLDHHIVIEAIKELEEKNLCPRVHNKVEEVDGELPGMTVEVWGVIHLH
jgi:hypothetical protein